MHCNWYDDSVSTIKKSQHLAGHFAVTELGVGLAHWSTVAKHTSSVSSTSVLPTFATGQDCSNTPKQLRRVSSSPISDIQKRTGKVDQLRKDLNGQTLLIPKPDITLQEMHHTKVGVLG